MFLIVVLLNLNCVAEATPTLKMTASGDEGNKGNKVIEHCGRYTAGFA